MDAASDTPPLQLLMISPSGVLGGAEEVLLGLAIHLPSFGIEPSVLALQDGPLVARLASHGVPVAMRDVGQLRDAGELARAWGSLTRMLVPGRFDAVYSNMAKAQLYAAPAASLRGVPTLWCQHVVPEPPHWIDRLATTLPADAVLA